MKEHLPDSHTDFLFAVMAEEFGIVMCLIVAGLYLFLFARCLRAAFRHDSVFAQYAIVGLVALIAMQAAINMGVNLQLLPAKGMTLPFLSYGGSSLPFGGVDDRHLVGAHTPTRTGPSGPRLGGRAQRGSSLALEHATRLTPVSGGSSVAPPINGRKGCPWPIFFCAPAAPAAICFPRRP